MAYLPMIVPANNTITKVARKRSVSEPHILATDPPRRQQVSTGVGSYRENQTGKGGCTVNLARSNGNRPMVSCDQS
jgi:hypothetical protein